MLIKFLQLNVNSTCDVGSELGKKGASISFVTVRAYAEFVDHGFRGIFVSRLDFSIVISRVFQVHTPPVESNAMAQPYTNTELRPAFFHSLSYG